MVYIALVIVGLAFGSFINAAVWRLHEHEQERSKAKPSKSYIAETSLVRGHSMCPSCKHRLSAKDLIPVLSWMFLRGKCRYCHKKISFQYPLIEILTTGLFLLSYSIWPQVLTGVNIVVFCLWLATLTGLILLAVYDIRWMILPSKTIYILMAFALVMAILNTVYSNKPSVAIINYLFAAIVGGGVFYLILILSKGKWIGGGDVRLGFLLGMLAGTAARSFLFIFLASLIGTIVFLAYFAMGKLKRESLIPYGPFLILGLLIVELIGSHILNWYARIALGS